MGAAMSSKWSSGLCGCGKTLGTCCMTCWLPCVTFGRNAEILDEGRTSCMVHGLVYGLLWTISCQWVISCIYREKLRSKYGLPAEPCCDCLVHFCCEPCALCQEHAELRSRGFDASKGWDGRPTVPPVHFPMFK
ncbi:cell number regulator 10-like [Dioscorea cayenensis subsp. rotundata]|uniref:Cell number regulator 10-like n=1 Tax=Dioscorea cayennensis subsp. rotundata TaxID=55577 RepID=A0AB40BQP3_DIOCR|nr:cell number regulator 10-like [Dioscorea cayenensis subsp. rotundata]